MADVRAANLSRVTARGCGSIGQSCDRRGDVGRGMDAVCNVVGLGGGKRSSGKFGVNAVSEKNDHRGVRPVVGADVVERPVAGADATAVNRPEPALRDARCNRAAGSATDRDHQPDWHQLAETARLMRDVYDEGYAFPAWSIDMLDTAELAEHTRTAVVYHARQDPLELVERVAREREPVNIAMGRFYDARKLLAHFGYRHGVYAGSSKRSLMPNIAAYCQTPIQSPDGDWSDVHVINAVGYAFDSPQQPDHQYFFPMTPGKWEELVARMAQMWTFIFECARRHQLEYVYLADVGGGAFSDELNMKKETRYDRLKLASLPNVQAKYPDIKVHRLPRIPDWCFTSEGRARRHDSLLVNAWDPWSMVGNGNERDASLDGFFGRSTAMALLCWPVTNPFLRYEAV